jgi:hypothetical protein
MEVVAVVVAAACPLLTSNKPQSRLNASNMKPACHSAKELPVWLMNSMFLLVHCEDQAFMRCTSVRLFSIETFVEIPLVVRCASKLGGMTRNCGTGS